MAGTNSSASRGSAASGKKRKSPYRSYTRDIYRNAGWSDFLPIIGSGEDAGKLRKGPPPFGYTGYDAKTPTDSDHRDWLKRIGVASGGMANCCIHLPDNVIALDIDQYGAKDGSGIFNQLVEELGPPGEATWRNTSRGANPAVGGHLFYRIKPEHVDLKWPGKLGVGIDILRAGHRYSMCWPSRNPDANNAMCRWYRPDGSLAPEGVVPKVNELPLLAKKWVDFATKMQERQKLERVDMDTEEVAGWLENRPDPYGVPCRATAKALTEILEELAGGHDTINNGLWRLTNLANEGHRGTLHAQGQLREAWQSEAQRAGHTGRTPGMFAREWRRMLDGAVCKTTASKSKPESECYCGVKPAWLAQLGADGEETIIDGDESVDAVSPLRATKKVHGSDSQAAEIIHKALLTGRFRYSPGLGWMEWDGRRWDAGDVTELRVLEFTRQFIKRTEQAYRTDIREIADALSAIEEEVKAGLNPDDLVDGKGKPVPMGKVVEKHSSSGDREKWFDLTAQAQNAQAQADMWLNMLNAGKISGIIRLCKGMDGVLTKSEEFDQHPDLINCRNGVVDLRTGELLESDPGLLFTKLAGGSYDPAAQSDLWDKALEAVPADAMDWFQTLMGQSITGYPSGSDALIACVGEGENGKTSVVAALLRASGDYGSIVSHRVLLSDHDAHPTEKMTLRGLRFAIMEETPEEGRLNPHQLKTTIGSAMITARHIRQDEVKFAPTHSLWINTNHLPIVDSTDTGTWRRLKAMPWPYRYLKSWQSLMKDTDRCGDQTLKTRIIYDEGIPTAALTWMIKGAIAWYENGQVDPQDPPSVAEKTARWRESSDVGYQFAMDYLIADPNGFIPAEVMKNQFNGFLESMNKAKWSSQIINSRLGFSMNAAGIIVDRDPTSPTKIRSSDRGSRPPARFKWLPGVVSGDEEIKPGRQLRVWRGVRFKTEKEMDDRHLKPVSKKR